MTQSPCTNSIATQNVETMMESDCVQIYRDDCKRYELLAQKTILRKTVIQNGRRNQILYSRVDNQLDKNKIEHRSVNWKALKSNSYLILIQADANNRPTGYLKIIENIKAVINKNFFGKVESVTARRQEDWIYYTRR